MKNTKERVRDIEDIMGRSSMNFTEVRKVEKENRIEAVTEKAMTENFPKLMKDLKSRI